MYGPAPARVKKTNIVRSRTGCALCRQKRRKCDEARPSCGRCAGRGQACDYGTAWEFRDATGWAVQRVRKQAAAAPPATPSPPTDQQAPDDSGGLVFMDLGIGSPFNFDPGDDQLFLDWPSPSSLPVPPVPSPPLAALSVPERMYLAHFSVTVLDTIPGGLHALEQEMLSLPPVRHAAISLAAASLANLHGRYDGPLWIPHQSHAEHALDHASRASEASSDIPPDQLVATALLLLYMKVDLDTVENWCSHFHSLEATVLEHHLTLAQTEIGIQLLRSYLHARAFFRSMSSSYRPMRQESAGDCTVAPLAKSYASSRETFALISCDALRIVGRILLCQCMHVGDCSPKTLLQKMLRWHSIVRGAPYPNSASVFQDEFQTTLSEEQCYEELKVLREELQACEPSLQLSSSADPGHPATLEPILFSGSDEAMHHASYAFAQLLCSEPLLRHLLRPLSSFPSSPTASPTHPWLHLLLRIATGLDARECARRNTYHHGMLYMLTAASMLCSSAADADTTVDPLAFAADYAARLAAAGIERDGAYYPVSLSRTCIRVLQRERGRGRSVFWMSTTHRENNSELMAAQVKEYVVVHGRMGDGRFFSDCVPPVEAEAEM
ncbi:Transcriptional regulatory protein moc3 [Lasiodiplodia theobromae]|nr:Transcriptional regulatory protein moc3 [Lasiodiplodia theobromae]